MSQCDILHPLTVERGQVQPLTTPAEFGLLQTVQPQTPVVPVVPDSQSVHQTMPRAGGGSSAKTNCLVPAHWH